MTDHDLTQFQKLLNELIRTRTRELMGHEVAEFPVLTRDALAGHKRQSIKVPGMYGGFAYWMKPLGLQPVLVVESWSRVIDGSGARHEITVEGCQRVAEGFV